MRILLLCLAFLTGGTALAQGVVLPVGEAKPKKPAIALLPPAASSANAAASLGIVQQTIRADLGFAEQFRVLPETEKTGADYSASGGFSSESGRFVYELRLVDGSGSKELLAKRYMADAPDLKLLGHSIASDIVQAITGKKGIFNTRIAFICDRSGKKEIFTASFDGSEMKQVTHIRSLALSPAWSPDGTRLAFSVYNRHSDNTKNIDLFEIDFSSGKLRLLSNKTGINSGASFSPDGKKIALTLSFTGNPEIHLLDPASRTATQLTRSIGFDVDPAFSPDGQSLAFVSSRPGKPMVYLMELARPAEPKRLTYAGAYNATPAWHPDGKKIAFAGWIDGRFDLFTITTDGAKIERLTKNEGNNEDPTFSPDGNFLAFSSSRSGGKNIFVMDANGGNVRRLTFGMGNCVSPKWSPYLR